MKNQISIALVCLLLASCQTKKKETEAKPVVEVITAKAEIEDLLISIQAPASIFPLAQANLASRITARILKLNVRKGDYVASGQVLAQLEDHDLIAQRDEAKASIGMAEATLNRIRSATLPSELEHARGQVAMAKASLDQAQKNYDRRKELFQKGGIPQRELLVSETDLALAKTTFEVAVKAIDLIESQSRDRDIQIAQSNLEQARAKLGQAVAQLEFATIRSSFAGVITDQLMFPGDLAKPDAPIFVVMDVSLAIARAQIPQSQGGGVRAGQSCLFTPTDGHDSQLTGRISVINQAIDPQRRTFEVWCEIPNLHRKLKAGVFGSLSINIGTAPHSVVVPVAAVQFAEEGGKGTVMVVDDKQIAHSVEVETGEVVDQLVRITGGLKEGDTVIVEGGYGLPDGTQVKKKEAKEKGEEGDKEKGEKK